MTFKRSYVLWVSVVAGAGLLGWLGMREQPLDVDTTLVRLGTLQVTVDAEGKTRVRDRYMLTAPVAGRLHRIEKATG